MQTATHAASSAASFIWSAPSNPQAGRGPVKQVPGKAQQVLLPKFQEAPNQCSDASAILRRPARASGRRVRDISCTAVGTESQNAPARPGPPAKNIVPLGEYGERVVLGEFEDEDEDMNIKLECDESGCVLVVGKKLSSLQEDRSEGYLHCGLTGCYYDVEEPVKDFKVLEGAGWRLGYETAPESEETFSAVLGAGGWSVALTASEFNDFTKLVQMLRKGLVTMDQDGIIGRDDVTMKGERGNVWMECMLPKKRLLSLQKFWKFGGRNETSAFELRFVLCGTDSRRQAEGYWPAEAVMDMLQKVDELTSVATQPAPEESPIVISEPTAAPA